MAETFDALTYRVDVLDEHHNTPYISGATTNAFGVDSIAKGVGVTADDRAKLNTTLALEGYAEIVGVQLPDSRQFRVSVRSLSDKGAEVQELVET